MDLEGAIGRHGQPGSPGAGAEDGRQNSPSPSTSGHEARLSPKAGAVLVVRVTNRAPSKRASVQLAMTALWAPADAVEAAGGAAQPRIVIAIGRRRLDG